MQWIDEKGLETWATFLNARENLMAMLADLIRMTIDDASRFRFPSGEVSQLRGWDGDLETDEAKSFVPAGKSKWEFGTGPGAPKANADYEKRTNQTPAAEMAENTLVLVSQLPNVSDRLLAVSVSSARNRDGRQSLQGRNPPNFAFRLVRDSRR